MKKSLKEIYQSATIIKDSSLDGKINRIARTPEHQALLDKLSDAFVRLNAKAGKN